MKSVRHAMILQLIESVNIETQEELANELERRGIKVTQATISRDIKELRLVKELSEKGRYKYATSDHGDYSQASRFIRIFAESVLSITPAANFIVIKTLAASANAAAEAIDGLRWPEIVGTLAGDNTIFVAIRQNDMAESICLRFRELMK